MAVFFFQTEKIPALIVKRHRLAVIDLMRIYDDIALRRLPEDPLKLHDAETPRSDNIAQHIPRPHAGKLVYIPNENETRSDRYGF